MKLVKLIVCLSVCFTMVHAVQSPAEQSSFLAQPSARRQKKKKSIATLRQEFVDACEVYAHAIIRELFDISTLMAYKTAAKKSPQLLSLLQHRYQELGKAERFFMTGACAPAEKKIKAEVVDEVGCHVPGNVSGDIADTAWQMVSLYARLQEKLLYAMTDILEQRETSCFMTSDKQQLQKYQEQLLFLQEESELLVKELQAMSNQATLKK